MVRKIRLGKWLEASKKILENADKLMPEMSQMLRLEIQKRQNLVDKFSFDVSTSEIDIANLQGSYHIIGSNQNKEQSSYAGFLHLTLASANRVSAEWIIDGEQTQKGKGFFKDDILVLNFHYAGEGHNIGKTYKGVVVYKFITDTVITGFWSEKYGDDNYLGLEEGRKLSDSEAIYKNAGLN